MQETDIANFLLNIKAVKISVNNPFTWTSGIKSPIYCDCRIVNSYVEARDAVIYKFVEVINNDVAFKTGVVAGVASGGISYGALIADRLKKPFIYVREKRKEYGLKKQIEGDYSEQNSVVLIEDLISTGGSSIKAVRAIREVNLQLAGLISIMTYGFKEAEDLFKDEDVKHASLCNLDKVLAVAAEKNIINSTDIDKIIQFRKSPKTWQQ